MREILATAPPIAIELSAFFASIKKNCLVLTQKRPVTTSLMNEHIDVFKKFLSDKTFKRNYQNFFFDLVRSGGGDIRVYVV